MKKFLLISFVVASTGILVSAFTSVDRKSTDPKPKAANSEKKGKYYLEAGQEPFYPPFYRNPHGGI